VRVKVFLVVGRGRGTQQHAGKRNELRDSSLWIAQGIQGVKGTKEIGETEDVTWGFQASPQVYYKYSPS